MQYYGETKFEIGSSVEEKFLRKNLYFILKNNYVPKQLINLNVVSPNYGIFMCCH